MQWNAQISESDSRKQMLLWILNRKYDLVYKKTFPLPGGIVSPCIRETLILRLSPLFESCRSLYPACGGLFILHILSTRTRHHHHLISLFHLLSVCVLVFLYECFHYFRSCSGLSVAFLLCSLVLSKCYCRVFQWDESAYVYINRREYNWLYTSYTLCRVLI